jgi:glycosyltransferase involved in cell wall biosynthesis
MLKYVMITDEDLDSGKIKKARAQVAALNDSGIKSELVIVTKNLEKKEGFDHVKLLYVEKSERENFLSRLKRANRIRSIIHEILKSLNTNDIFYYRGFVLWYYPITFFKPFRKYRIISEHQSIEIKQRLRMNSPLPAFIDLLSGNITIGQSDGIIGVTDEITAFWTKRLFYKKIPRTTIPNGFDVHSVEVRNHPLFDPHDIHILFVGNISHWHGLDRMIRGIADYRGPVQIHFHIVGDGAELENLKQLKNSLAPGAAIHFHGFLRGCHLDSMFDTCHIAVGSLGMHRKGLSQTSELKAREYCARGMPYVIACGDTDFPNDFPYILRLAADESPINMEDIISFTHKIYNTPNHPFIMNKYAEKNLDWTVKVRKLKDFIEKNLWVITDEKISMN